MGYRFMTSLTMVLAIAALAGCSHQASAPTAPAAMGSAATSAAPPPPTQSARLLKWIDLNPGDCLGEPPPADPAVVTVIVVDCATPHLAEAFLRVGVPVDTALSGTANAQCNAGLVNYAGTASGYTITYLIDSDQDRTSNNPYPSTVICLLQNAQGNSLTGSAKH